MLIFSHRLTLSSHARSDVEDRLLVVDCIGVPPKLVFCFKFGLSCTPQEEKNLLVIIATQHASFNDHQKRNIRHNLLVFTSPQCVNGQVSFFSSFTAHTSPPSSHQSCVWPLCLLSFSSFVCLLLPSFFFSCLCFSLGLKSIGGNDGLAHERKMLRAGSA